MLFFLLFTIFVNFPPPKSQSRTPIIILGNHISAIKMIHFFLFSKHHSQPAIIFPAPSPEKTHFHTWVGKSAASRAGTRLIHLLAPVVKRPHTHTHAMPPSFSRSSCCSTSPESSSDEVPQVDPIATSWTRLLGGYKM